MLRFYALPAKQLTRILIPVCTVSNYSLWPLDDRDKILYDWSSLASHVSCLSLCFVGEWPRMTIANDANPVLAL